LIEMGKGSVIGSRLIEEFLIDIDAHIALKTNEVVMLPYPVGLPKIKPSDWRKSSTLLSARLW
jgi:hypothetical protein